MLYICVMKYLRLVILIMVMLSWCDLASAQFYYTGRGSASTKWMQIKSKDYQLLYPSQYRPTALGLSSFMDKVVPHLSYGMPDRIIRTPLILRTESVYSNGYVTWAPKRDEMVTSPPLGGLSGGPTYAVPWLKQLAVHEWRHVVQMSTMKRGLTKIATWLLGEGGVGLGLLTVSDWVLEGDATLAETQFSEFGRGLQPAFTLEYRGYASDGKLDFKRLDPWVSGSYKRNVPDIYKYGYQIITASETFIRPNLWSDILEYSARVPIIIAPDYFYLRRHYQTSVKKITQHTFDDLNKWWQPTFTPNNFSTLYFGKPRDVYTWYDYPQQLSSSPSLPSLSMDIVALKHSFEFPGRFMALDTSNMTERRLFWMDGLSSRPLIDGRMMYWSEYKRHPIWEQVSYSQLRARNLTTGKSRVVKRWGRDYFATPLSFGDRQVRQDRQMGRIVAMVSLDDQSNSYIAAYSTADSAAREGVGSPSKNRKSSKSSKSNGSSALPGSSEPSEPSEPSDLVSEVLRYNFPRTTEVLGLAWSEPLSELYFIALDDRGMWIGAMGIAPSGDSLPVRLLVTGVREVTAPSLATLSDLYCKDSTLYFGSIASGKDEVHSLDIHTGVQRRITQSKLGSRTSVPSASGSSAESGMLHTTYTGGGWQIAHTHADTIAAVIADSATVVEYSRLPNNILNPPRYKWDVPKIDTIPITLGAPTLHKDKRYRKAGRQFNVHTWAPLGFDGDYLFDEAPLFITFGATAFFQSTMSDMRGYATYGWRNNSNWLKGRLIYTGLPVELSITAEYGGGKQLEYGSPSRLTSAGAYSAPALKPNVQVGGSLAVPLNLSSGAWQRYLTPSFSATYSNARLYDPLVKESPLGPLFSSSYSTGYTRYGAAIYWGHTLRSAYQSLRPRWGYLARVSYSGAFSDDFANQKTILLRGYLPGLAPTHSVCINVAGAMQQADKRYAFSSKPLSLKGVYDPYSTRSYMAATLEYAMPIAYPDWGWDGIIYFKRLWVNLYGGYSNGHYMTSSAAKPLITKEHFSYGLDLNVDFNFLRTFAQSITFTIAKPSTSYNVWFNVGFNFNF